MFQQFWKRLFYSAKHKIQNVKRNFLKYTVDYQFFQNADDKLVITPT